MMYFLKNGSKTGSYQLIFRDADENCGDGIRMAVFFRIFPISKLFVFLEFFAHGA